MSGILFKNGTVPGVVPSLKGFRMSFLLKRFLSDTSGATAIEYGLIAALISVALIGGATALGGSVNTMFNNVGTNVTNMK
jgi:pilus assembly protein Flp/PilA